MKRALPFHATYCLPPCTDTFLLANNTVDQTARDSTMSGLHRLPFCSRVHAPATRGLCPQLLSSRLLGAHGWAGHATIAVKHEYTSYPPCPLLLCQPVRARVVAARLESPLPHYTTQFITQGKTTKGAHDCPLIAGLATITAYFQRESTTTE